MAGSDMPRRFQSRHLAKAVRSFVRRFRGVIYFGLAVCIALLWGFVAMRQGQLADRAAHMAAPPSRLSRLPNVPAGKPLHHRQSPHTHGGEPNTGKEKPLVDIVQQLKEDERKPLLEKNPATALDGGKAVHEEPLVGNPDGTKKIEDVLLADTSATTATTEKKAVSEFAETREKYASEKMSVVVLFHNEYDSLKSALASWLTNGLIDNVDEVLFFVNGGSTERYFLHNLPDYNKVPEEKRKLVIETENLPLGLAITRMVSLAKHEYVLLLEKDWALIENSEKTKSRLIDSKVIVGSGVAHVIRHRHRHNPGVPLHALIMHQGREASILRQQPNLLCYVHHWQKDPTTMYPGQGRMWRCGGEKLGLEEDDVFCATSKYCCWANNPCVFKKSWFIDEVGNRFLREYALEKAKYGKTSPFLDFEYYTNWRSYAWTDKNFTIALGEGLFSHAETEHKHFNTFWYAHYRLTSDYEEVRNEYLRNETRLKKMGGVHYDTNGPPPPPMIDRFPTEFARKYHWADTFKGDFAQQIATISRLYQEYQREYRVSAEEWKKHGSAATNANKQVPWRHYITQLHHIAEKGEMMVPPKQPYEMNMTLVTSLLDVGRDALGKDGYQFNREFKIYVDGLLKWMEHDYPKVIYTSKNIAEEVMSKASEKAKETTKFVFITREELGPKWIGQDNYDKIQEIRKSEKWRGRASWLKNSPQAGLADYNPLVMSKLFMLRDASRKNLWKTSHFLFLDAKHNCMDPANMTPKKDHILRAHMFGKFFLTYFDYTPSGGEVHGFEYSALNEFFNLRPNERVQLVKVARGGIFGGSEFVLEYITAMYDVALTASLRMGLMGTEENILSILMYQVQQYIDPFSNNWACFRTIEREHRCSDKGKGYNCEVFSWMRDNV